MSRYDIRGMQASGMTTQQINDAISQAEANAPKLMKDFRSQIDPQKVVAGVNTPAQPTKPPVMSPVKTPVKQPVRQPIKPPTMSPAKPLVRQPIKPPVMSPVKPQVKPPVKPAATPYVYSARPSLFPHIDGIKKKGGEVKKYAKGGKINLDACGVSTAQKSKSSPKW